MEFRSWLAMYHCCRRLLPIGEAFDCSSGTGKTAIMRDKLAALDADALATANINMNSLSDAPSVQLTLEQHLEKKSGKQAA